MIGSDAPGGELIKRYAIQAVGLTPTSLVAALAGALIPLVVSALVTWLTRWLSERIDRALTVQI